MFNKRTELVRRGDWLDPFAVFTRLAPEFAEIFGGTDWPTFHTRARTEATPWSPNIDVFERDNRLIARVDLPGTKKEDVKVEVVDGWLTISGERKYEAEEEKQNFTAASVSTARSIGGCRCPKLRRWKK
jgi:HSP20 family protein